MSPRRFHVFAGRDPALTIEDRPGRLHSLAALPEGAMAPEHPFVHGVSHSGPHEHALRQLLLQSADFDAFVARLVAAGYDLAAGDDSPFHMGTPKRLRGPDGALAGALWPRPGPLATLSAPPDGRSLPVRVTAYRDDAVAPLVALLADVPDADAALDALEDAGWRLTAAGLAG